MKTEERIPIDYWLDMENDPDAQERIKKSVALLDVKSGMTVLDIGCHKQEASEYLSPDSFYQGIDCQIMHPKTIQLDIDGGFVWREKVDRILCLETLEHLIMPKGTLKSIWTTLDDDGIAVISLPNEATIFHRLRCLFGIVDQECFNYGGKHLHLPNLKQCRTFLKEQFLIVQESAYCSYEIRGTRQPYIAIIVRLLPHTLLQLLSRLFPSLFARGFIFKLRKKI